MALGGLAQAAKEGQPVPPTAELETCSNCGRAIGKVEIPCAHQESVVCAECYGKLNPPEPAVRRARSWLPEGLEWPTWRGRGASECIKNARDLHFKNPGVFNYLSYICFSFLNWLGVSGILIAAAIISIPVNIHNDYYGYMSAKRGPDTVITRGWLRAAIVHKPRVQVVPNYFGVWHRPHRHRIVTV